MELLEFMRFVWDVCVTLSGIISYFVVMISCFSLLLLLF